MIRKPSNWESVQEFTERAALPLDAYVCKVKRVAVRDNDYGEQMHILFDINEGEYAGFYARDYAGNPNLEKKWRGVLRVWLPNDDGSEKDEITKRILRGVVTSFEKSNPGYVWNWKEESLVGKVFGVLYRKEEWEYNGRNGWAVRPFRAISADSVREGSYTLPKDKPLSKHEPMADSAPHATASGYAEAEEEELPF